MIRLADHSWQIDIAKFMKVTGYTKRSAETTWGRLKQKIRYHASNDSIPYTKDGDQVASPVTKKVTPRVFKRKKASNDSDEDQDVGPKDVFRAGKRYKSSATVDDAAGSSEEPDEAKTEPVEDEENADGGVTQAVADGRDDAEVSV